MPRSLSRRYIRTFIALPVAESLVFRLVELQEELKKARAKVKWVSSDHFHITLKFLGDTPEERVPDIIATLTAHLQRYEPFPVVLEGVGAFPKISRPQTLWAGAAGDLTQMRRMAQEIDEIMRPYGFPVETRPFQAHMTLGRVQSAGRLESLSEAIRRLENAPVGLFQADRIIYFRSDLSPEGPHYTALETIRLSSAARGSQV